MQVATGARTWHDGEWSWTIAPFGHPAVREGQLLHRGIYERLGFLLEPAVVSDDGLLVDEWSHASHHMALFRNGEIAGHLRLIERRIAELPSKTWWPELALPEHTWEVSALVVNPENRDFFDTAKRLYRCAFHYALTTECTHWIGVVERQFLWVMRKWFPIDSLGQPRELHGGTKNVPAIVSFESCFDAMAVGDMKMWWHPPATVAHRWARVPMAIAGGGQ